MVAYDCAFNYAQRPLHLLILQLLRQVVFSATVPKLEKFDFFVTHSSQQSVTEPIMSKGNCYAISRRLRYFRKSLTDRRQMVALNCSE